jgi:pimeloyl-ACP methyl ester carboxylesterase
VVPGLAVSAYMRPTAAALARCGYRAWVLDLPGFGRSGEPMAEPRGMADLADEAAQWLSAQRIDRPVLVGQSLGTQVVARLAGAASVLVLQGPTVDPRYRTPVRALGRWLLDSTRESAAMGRTQVPEWRRAGARRMAGTFRAALDDDLDETLSGARPPLLVVRGSRPGPATRMWRCPAPRTAPAGTTLRASPPSWPTSRPRATSPSASPARGMMTYGRHW